MKVDGLNPKFWEQRYESGETGWDIGYPAPPITEYFDQIDDKELRILIPGCGRAHEGEYLFNKGFKNLYLLDSAPLAKAEFMKRCPDFPNEQYVQEDFFAHQGVYDRIVEQTFFCALHPLKRKDYAKKISDILAPKGRLIGVFFDDELFSDHPPFGGHKTDYLPIFEPFFKIEKMETAYNSIKPRQGRELFINLQKK